MELYEAIEKRRTVREFEDRPVEEKITKKLLRQVLGHPQTTT